MKLPVAQTDNFIIYLEHYKDFVWLHTDVYKWSPKIKKVFTSILDHIQQTLQSDLLGLVDNDKLGKFGKAIGFNFYKTVLGYDNKEYDVFIRRNKWVA
jgi:hypothetical protein